MEIYLKMIIKKEKIIIRTAQTRGVIVKVF